MLDIDLKILTIDIDDELCNREAIAWAKKRVALVQVKSMQGAIINLSNGGRYIAVCINADNISYLPQLSIMHDLVPNMPILPITSNFSAKECVLACKLGAKYLYRWQELSEDNVEIMLSILGNDKIDFYNERNRIPIWYHYNLLVIPGAYRFVFMDDFKIPFTKHEYEVLYLLLKQKGKIVKYKEIYAIIWGNEYVDNTHDSIHQVIQKIKKKLNADFIENIRGIGYRFKIQDNMT